VTSNRIAAVLAGGLLLTCVAGCRVLDSGPSDQEIAAAIKKVPPSPPTAGPTYLAEIESVRVQERGPYSTDGKYWPVRIRLKGGVKIKLTNAFQLGLLADDAKKPAKPIEFVEDARFTKDDFGNWRVLYNYDPNGPKWRL